VNKLILELDSLSVWVLKEKCESWRIWAKWST